MTTRSPLAPKAATSTASDALLLVTSETSPSQEELARHFSSSSAISARPCRLGTRMRDDLASVLASRPFCIVALLLSIGESSPMLDDLTGLLRWAQTRWPDTTFLQSEPFGSPEHVVGWASHRIREAAGYQPVPSTADETAILIVGQGDTPESNAEVCALARLLWENRDYDLVDVAFAKGTRPTVAEGIDRLRRLGAKQVIALPLALLDGPWYREVCDQVESGSGSGVSIARPLLTPGAAASVARKRYGDAIERWTRSGEDGLSIGHVHAGDPLSDGDDILPPRYRGGAAVSSASMGSTPLIHDAEGRVAWDRIWQSFCNLALAGGPPHRGTLLEPPTKEEVLADPGASSRVIEEIARGLAMITRLPVVTDTSPGWVGLVCPDEEMAVWMLRAIVVENVSVRREGATLFLPAGPAYRIEKEIKNVITAVAKTHHYWTEHRTDRLSIGRTRA